MLALRPLQILHKLQGARWRRGVMQRALKYDAEIQEYLKRTSEINSPAKELEALFKLRCDRSNVGLLKEE